jgi:hypothetical protein
MPRISVINLTLEAFIEAGAQGGRGFGAIDRPGPTTVRSDLRAQLSLWA